MNPEQMYCQQFKCLQTRNYLQYLTLARYTNISITLHGLQLYFLTTTTCCTWLNQLIVNNLKYPIQHVRYSITDCRKNIEYKLKDISSYSLCVRDSNLSSGSSFTTRLMSCYIINQTKLNNYKCVYVVNGAIIID